MTDPICRPLDADAPAGKTCRRCREFKPLDAYNRAAKGKFGRRARCRKCGTLPPLLVDPTGKICTKCGAWKPLTYYHRQAMGKFGLTARCRECTSDDWRERMALPGARENRRAYGRRYAKTDKGRAAAFRRNVRHNAARRAAGRIPPDWREARLAAQRNRCCYCRRPFTADRRPTIEHLLPVSRGGDNQPENLALACKSCNSRRGNRAIPAPVQTTLC